MRKKCGILCLIAILLIDTIPIQAKEGGASGENEKPVTLRICNWEEKTPCWRILKIGISRLTEER